MLLLLLYASLRVLFHVIQQALNLAGYVKEGFEPGCCCDRDANLCREFDQVFRSEGSRGGVCEVVGCSR